MIKRTKPILALLFLTLLVSCGANTNYNIGISKSWDVSSKSWVMDEAFTYPEERIVATKHPIIPVIVENLAK